MKVRKVMYFSIQPDSDFLGIFESIKLTSFSWEGAPSGLEIVHLENNQLTSFSWEGAPSGLEYVSLENNQLTNIIGNKPYDCIVYGMKIIRKVNWELFQVSTGECLICRDTEGDVLCLPCHESHIFHKECLQSWFEKIEDHNCPLCFTFITTH